MSTGVCRWLILLISLSTWINHTNSKEMRVVCYYTNWSVYRPGTAKFSPQNINPYLCTHLIYAFGGFTKENTLKPFDKYQDIEKGGYAKFTGLKTYNKNLKTMLAIGGWNEGSSRFSPMVANPERRKELVKNAVKFLRQNHFDGLDLDWEYPSFRDGGKPRDRDNYAQLVKELREEFERESEKTGRSRLLLTMAVPAGIEYINKGYDIPKLTKYLDWMNILSYDYHSAFEPAVNHHAPLYSLEEASEYNYDTELNIDYTIQHYLELGADPNKLVMGIPTYGRSYTLFNPDANEIGAPADGPGEMGEATRENGYLAYYEVCENVKSQDWTVVQPNDKAMGPYAYKENQWVGYDDENIVRKKSEYVAENNLGGIMFWAIDNDDFRGNCHGRPYPLIEAAKEALLSAYGITEENLISPPAKPLKTKTRGRTRGSTKTEEAKDNTSTTKVSSNSRRRLRNKSKSKAEETRRKETRKTADFTSTYSSLKVVTPSYTTPAPPSTPDQGGSFKCEDEGFFPHPKDCKKYFWCLGGPGDTGIIAHQFTCPAGLYFNKAADSCDYTQNVLCNKKLARVTASTTSEKSDASTTTPKPTQSSVFSTTRVPPKITAATSRTTFRQTTTTEANFEDEEYEYDDEDGEDDRKIDSEEDPKVIKELIDLIRKAGGIEELEKQLKVGSGGSDFTTQSAISKTLYERVLSKAAKNPTSIRKNTYASLNRNSRGPQNDGIQNEEKTFSRSKEDRGRPQYTSIVRQRASPAKSENEDDKESEDKAENSKNLLRKTSESEYVNIRRSRISTTTQEPQQAKFNRNKILGEDTDEDKDTNLQISSPQYVNIRRQKPTTVEGSTTSKYTVIRRGSTTDSPPEDEADEEVTSKYKTIRRGTTAVPVTPDSVDDKNFNHKIRTSSVDPTIDNGGSTEKYLTIRRGSLTSTLSSVKFDNISTYKAIRRGSTTEPSSKSTTYEPASDVTTRYKTISRTLPTSTVDVTTGFADEIATTEPLTSTSPNTININNDVNLLTTKLISEEPTTTDNKVSSVAYSSTEIITDPVPALPEKKSPQLLEPRPFSLNTRGTTSTKSVTESTTQASKVSDSNFKFRLKPKASDLHIGVVSSQNSPTTEHLKQKQRNFSKLDLNDQDEPLHSTPNSLNRARKRFFTTEAYIEKEVNDALDQSRTFRPSDIADLSSLTAVDFDVMKKFNGEGNHKRGRPRIASTETGTTTEKIEELFKTASRYLQVRKETNSGNVVKNKRVFPTQHSDQINSSSNVNSTSKRLRGANKTLEEIENTSPANRRIIRRFRTTERSSTTNDQILSTSTVRSLRKPGRYTSRFTEITNRSGPTVQSTTDNLEHILNRRPTRLPFGQNQSDNEDNSTDDLSTEEDENIKLSESNIRENSDINNISGGKKSSNADLNKSKVKELHSKSDLDEKPTNQKDQTEAQEKVETKPTEPNIIVRTRKIVRKLKPTEATLLDDHTATTLGTRKRKIIRRIRPSSTIAPEEIATAQKDVYITNSENKAKRKKIYIRGRPTTGNFEISTEKLENPNNNSDLNKSIFDSKQANLDDDGPEVTRIVKKPLYRSRTSTTGSADISSTPRYSVYTRRPSTTAGDSQISSNSEEEDDDTESEEIDSDDAVATLAPENVNDTTTTTIESTIYENNKTVDDLEHSDENKDIAEEQLDENENSKENKTTKVETSTVRNHLLRRQKDRPSFTRPKLSNLSKPGEATDKSSESLYRKKERPTFTRSRSTTTSTSQPDIIGRPKYRTFSRTTTSATTLTSTSSTTPTSVINSTDALDETLLNIEHNKTNNVTETISSVPDILETTTEGFTTVEITTILDKSTSEAINITTSTEAVTLNPLDHIIKTTTENFTLTTEADLIATNNTLEDKEDLATTVNILDVDDLNVTVSSPTDDITSTGKISVTTVASEIDGISPKNDSTFDGLVSSTESNSTETTTPYLRRSTLKPINARPKLSPKRNFTTTQATTESVKSYRNQNRFKIRTHPTTENSVIQNKIRSSSPLPINKSIYKYRTTERNIYKAPLDEKEEQNKEETEDNVEDEEQTDDRHEEVYDDYDEEDTSEEKDEDQLTKVSHIRPPGYKSELASKRPPTRVVNKPISLLGKSNKPSVPNRNRTANKPPLFRKSTTIRSTNKPSFAKTTEAPVTEDLSDINTEAVKNRNKNLFAKKRKMNTPFAGPTLETSSVADNTNVTEELITLAPQITEPVTKSSVQQTETTEFLTTLHHIFAEVNDSDTSNPETTTESINTTSSSSNGKVERLIEVNRIIEVKTKEAKVHSGIVEEQTKTQLPTIDKIGAVNRITFIQVVGGNSSNATIIEKTLSTELNEIKINQTDAESNNLATTNKPPVTINIDGSFIVPEIAKVEEITPAKSSDPVYENPFSQRNREDRKFEIYGESKVIDYSSLNKLYGSGKDATGKAEIIDGISHINIITPRPVYSTEASTIALQGLFQTDTPQTLNKNLGNNEELLETDHSRFVNVRILGQDENLRDNKGIKDHTKLVPIKILSQDEEVTMKAEVVEVKPRSHKDVIKIVPIRVEMSRKLAHDVPKKVQTLNSPFLTKVESGVPKVNIKLITPTEVK